MITGKETIPHNSEVLDPTSDADKEKIRICKANKNAYAYLMLSCTDNNSFSAIDEARTLDLQEGDTSLAWNNLLNLYKPKDQTTEVELLTDFQELQMKTNEKLDTYFSEVDYLQGCLKDVGYSLTDNQIIAQVITTMPETYKDHKPIFNQQMKDETNPLRLLELKELLRTAYKQMNKDYENTSKDTAFIAAGMQGNNNDGFKKQFKGHCSKCRRYGHKASECKSDQMYSFKGKCNYCGIMRHKENECHKKIKDLARGYDNSNNNNRDNGNNNQDNNKWNMHYNYAFVSEKTVEGDFQNDFWIADMGASAHITNDDTYLFNMRETNRNDSITVGNGVTLPVQKIGDLQMTCMQPNNVKATILLQNVKYVPEMMVNLFSLTRVMTDGRKLTSNKKYIGIIKNGSTLWFNHMLHKNKGELLVGAKF